MTLHLCLRKNNRQATRSWNAGTALGARPPLAIVAPQTEARFSSRGFVMRQQRKIEAFVKCKPVRLILFLSLVVSLSNLAVLAEVKNLELSE